MKTGGVVAALVFEQVPIREAVGLFDNQIVNYSGTHKAAVGEGITHVCASGYSTGQDS